MQCVPLPLRLERDDDKRALVALEPCPALRDLADPTQTPRSARRICCLIIGPTFFSASLYWAGGIIIEHVAKEKSWLSGKWFKTVFLTADVVSLVVQAVGGGMAGSAVGTTNEKQSEDGSKCVA